MDQAIDITELLHTQRIGIREAPFCDFCSARAVVAIHYTVFGSRYLEKRVKYLCNSHMESFEFGADVGNDCEKVWL